MSSERLEVKSFSEARFDHQVRYAWAKQHLPETGTGLDAFCGCGYGTAYLREEGKRRCVGVDGSLAAIGWAREHFGASEDSDTDGFVSLAWPHPWFRYQYGWDFVVSLESLEHVEDPIQLFVDLARSLRVGGVLVASSPNADLLPKLPGTFPHHHQHLTLETLLDLGSFEWNGADTGKLELLDWAGQDVYELHPEGRVKSLIEDELRMVPRERTPGQFTLIAARRTR